MCFVARNAEIVWGLTENTGHQGLTQAHWERGDSGTKGTLERKTISEASKSKQLTVVFLERSRIPGTHFLRWKSLLRPRRRGMEEAWAPGAQPPHLQFWCLFLWGAEADWMELARVLSSLPDLIEYHWV